MVLCLHEVEVVIQFLNARNESPAEIRCQLVTVYGNDMTVRRTVVKWQTVTASSTPHKTLVQDAVTKR